MNKEQWESLKIGDKVRVKSFEEIKSLLTLEERCSDVIGEGTSILTGYSDSFVDTMERFCGEVFEVKEFWRTEDEDENQAVVLAKGSRDEIEYNFLPEWLEITEVSEIEKLERMKEYLEKAEDLAYKLGFSVFHNFRLEGGINNISHAKNVLNEFIINYHEGVDT